MLKLSSFCLKVNAPEAVVVKSNASGAVVKLSSEAYSAMESWLCGSQEGEIPNLIKKLMDPHRIIVSCEEDEFASWRAALLDRRNNKAKTFTLHFEPTIQCQLQCNYCFENGADRGTGMGEEILSRSVVWLENYFDANPDVTQLKVSVFGGEPLLRKDILVGALTRYKEFAYQRGCEFWVDMTTNGELLDEEIAKKLSLFNWKRVQVTLDGPQRIHDSRRFGKNTRPTFDLIITNLRMLLRTDYVKVIDLRMTFDSVTAPHIGELIRFLATLGNQEKIHLSLGFTTSTFLVQINQSFETKKAAMALEAWKTAKDYGFAIPNEYSDGPLCVATSKHAATLQPNGDLQKCFCNSGRPEFRFGTVFEQPTTYTKDTRFEGFMKRTDQCVDEKCPHLPICGGGCTHNSLVANGVEGFMMRFCQKSLLTEMNEGLMSLTYL